MIRAVPPTERERRGLLLMGHGTRSERGGAEFADLTARVQARLGGGGVELIAGFIELTEPDLDTALDELVARGCTEITMVPVLLFEGGHAASDGPAALDRARQRHPTLTWRYTNPLGTHRAVVDLARRRIGGANPDVSTWAILGASGWSDPWARSDLAKVAHLCWDPDQLGGVEIAFASLVRPTVDEAMQRCRALGAQRVIVVPFFLATGTLSEKLVAAATASCSMPITITEHLGTDDAVVEAILDRFETAG